MSAIQEPWQSLSISGPAIGIESLALGFIEATAMILIAATARREFDVGAALRARISAQPTSLHRLLVQRAQTHRHGHEEDRATALEAIRSVVDSVDRDVNRTARQVVVSRVATNRGRCSLGESR